ncbi:nitrilase-related carbon-nitrogen hydrolase [Halosegnis marinus]|uniref:Nitrilase-related carbon-nitrogen hydrolase n=1 Tax=Halosegnis marinus TaxID=3034023 RepID=A0ABD5ZS48_9EURY|nr:nitrilase-related carbon-nitrogen hydrolase [Halosegnis sp. DT85]
MTRVVCAQIRVENADVTGNVARAVAAVEDAAAEGADLVVLPEIFNVGYFAFDSYDRAAEPLDGPTLTRVREAAAENDVGVLAGSIVEDLAASDEGPADEGLANTSVLFDRAGERLAVYRKHHLFGYGSAETELLTPGEDLAVAEFDGHTVGMTTCYDLRFPELYRALAERGATLVCVPSAWPYPRVEHWKLLPKARAVENQLYVATANGSGSYEGAELLGRSSVYDPWGTTLASSDDDPALVAAEADPERVAAVREEFPAWRDRRGDV